LMVAIEVVATFVQRPFYFFGGSAVGGLRSSRCQIQHSRQFLNKLNRVVFVTNMPSESALKTVQKLCLSKRLRLRGYFLDFDRLNHKRVTRSMFDRAMGSTRLPLTTAQVDELKDQYSNGDNSVDYDSFCREVDTVFFVEGLEQSPTKQVRLTLQGEELHPYGTNATPDEMEAAKQVVNSVAREVRLRGVILKNFFRDFDPNNTGYVSKSRFSRGLQTALPRSVTYEDSEALAKVYQDSTGSVNYRALHDDTNDLSQAESLPASSGGGGGNEVGRKSKLLDASFRANSGMAQDAQQAMNKLVRLASERRIRISIFFEDWDKMRTGCVSARVFRATLCTALSNMLDTREVDIIAEHYSVAGTDKVRYKSMLDYINLAFNPSGLEKEPLKGCESIPWSIAHRPRIVLPVLSNAKENVLQSCLNDIRSQVMQARSSLIDIFRDFDRGNKGVVSETQFQRCLAIRKIMPQDNRLRELLMEKYGVTTGGGNGVRMIQYRPFLDRVARANTEVPSSPTDGDTTTTTSEATSNGKTPADLAATWHATGVTSDQVMFLLRQFVAQRRVRVPTFFRDADPLNKGLINVTRFRRCMKELVRGSDLTPAHLQLLEERYCSGGAGDLSDPSTWVAGQPQINWRSLTADVEAATHVANLEQDPTADVMAMTQSILNQGKVANSTLNGEEDEQLTQALKDLTQVVKRNNSLTRPLFAKFDRVGRGQIPWTQFRRGITMLVGGTHFNYITDLIAKSEFAIRQTGEYGNNYLVDYKAICNVIDPMEQRRIQASPAVDRKGKLNRNASTAADPTALIVRIREVVKGRGINLKLFFEDYDKLRRGLVSEDRFFRSMDTCLSTNFRLSSAEKICLANYYRRPGSDQTMVDYMVR
jgi:Ca2+-binding EF-hand superfamily protein